MVRRYLVGETGLILERTNSHLYGLHDRDLIVTNESTIKALALFRERNRERPTDVVVTSKMANIGSGKYEDAPVIVSLARYADLLRAEHESKGGKR
jgi:hypothetical protein